MRLQETHRAARVGERARECHARRLVVAVREAQRRDSRVRERLTRRDDMRLVGMAAETVKYRDPADGSCRRQMQRSFQLAARHDERNTLQCHSAAAGLAGTSGMAISSKTFCRSSTGVRELIS